MLQYFASDKYGILPIIAPRNSQALYGVFTSLSIRQQQFQDEKHPRMY